MERFVGLIGIVVIFLIVFGERWTDFLEYLEFYLYLG